jgi:iron complex outermembrane recepter protein
MKHFILSTTFILLLLCAFAQTGKVSGTIHLNDNPAEGATVSLLRAKDSAVIKFSVVNKEGAYTFDNIRSGKYLVSATAVGHRKNYSGVIDIDSSRSTIEIPTLKLTPLAKSLTNVSVTSTRALVEQKIDRTVVNVDASITNIGTSALEVLEKSPGVSVDRDGNISLKGKDGVLVMVDGRPSQLSGADLANLLRNMSSTQLDQIEIMTNPPARYDASGTSGVINIKTKKNLAQGYNGSATVTLSQGRYPKVNEGFNFNYRKNKVNLFTNLSHNYRKGFSDLMIQRKLYNNAGALENYFDQSGDLHNEGSSYNAKVGADFFPTKTTTLGIIVNGSLSPSTSGNVNTTNISNSLKDLQSVTRAFVDNTNDWKSFSTNVYFRKLLDKKGKELTADMDFLSYSADRDMFMENSYKDAAGNPLRKADTLVGDLPQNIKVYGGRVDYVHPLKKDARFETGIKSSFVSTDNNALYDSIQNGLVVRDRNRSNHFLYEENINAAYVNLSTPLSKKWSVQLGLRLENTNSKGRQLTTGEKFDRHYTQLFPTAYFQFKANEKNNFGINFGRRVRRPDYGSLNPFIRFIDRYTYEQGNPLLKPAISNNIELSHNWRNQITTTLNYSSTTDIIDQIVQQKGQEAYRSPSNIASQKQYGISVNANTPITKWWTSSMNINLYNNHYEGVASGTPVEMSMTTFFVTGTQQFKLSKTISGEINGRFATSRLEGIMKVNTVGILGFGLSQQVMKGAGTLRFSVRDILYTQRFNARTKYGNVDFSIQQVSDSRVASLAFNYRFSKGKKIAPIKRTTGSAGEEQERIGL